MIIEKDCNNWKKNHVSNKMNFSSNVNEVIRSSVWNLFTFFLQKDFAHIQIHIHAKAQKSTKSTNTRISVFYGHKMLPFLFLFACVRFAHFVRVKFFAKKFKAALMTSFTFLLNFTLPFSKFLSPRFLRKISFLLIFFSFAWEFFIGFSSCEFFIMLFIKIMEKTWT